MHTGAGEGQGYTINLPVPAGSGSEEFRALVQHVVVPAARDHRPGLPDRSRPGFDAPPRRSAGQLRVLHHDAFGDMSATMRNLGAELAPRSFLALEGGYDPGGALARSALQTAEALGGDREPEPASPQAAAAHSSTASRG